MNCNFCKNKIDDFEPINNIVFWQDKEYHKECMIEHYQDQGYYQCDYCTNITSQFYIDKLINKEQCLIIENDEYNKKSSKEIKYKAKYYHESCFKKKYELTNKQTINHN
jgi:hypothetical protein